MKVFVAVALGADSVIDSHMLQDTHSVWCQSDVDSSYVVLGLKFVHGRRNAVVFLEAKG